MESRRGGRVLVTFSDLLGANPQSWTTAADDILGAAKQCERIKDDIHDNGVRPLDQSWRSKAYGQARSVLTTVADRAEVTSILARSVIDPLDTLNHAVQTAQTELYEGIVAAQHAGLFVNLTTGAVTLPVTVVTAPTMAAMKRAQESAQQMIDNAVKAATAADALCTQSLTAAMNADITKISIADAQTIQADNTKKALLELQDTLPPPGTSAADVAAWWNGLTPQEQFDLERACPTQLYNMAGIPDEVKKAIDRPDLGYSSAGTTQFALDNWNNSHLDWSGKNNCTNFVSNALAYGGNMPFKEDSWLGIFPKPRRDDTEGWSDGTNGDGSDPLPPGLSHTRSWGGAQANHDFFLNNGGTTVSPSEARPGDVLYYTQTQQDGDLKPGDTHHAAVVTAVLPDNQVLYTQHTGDAQNYPLTGRLPEGQSNEGQQKVEIVQPKVTW